MKDNDLLSGEFYHIFSRTVGHEILFRTEENYSYFLKKYHQHCSISFQTFAYCLLPNHFHFLVKVNENTSSKAALASFSNLLNSYSKAYNKLYERHGGLFQRKFKRKQIAKDSYLSQVMIYIHQNPQNHGVIDDFQKWKYSSYQDLISSKATQLERENVLDWFGGLDQFQENHQLTTKFELSEELSLE
jgi:REP element-mobilizing transposase RayT